MLSNDPLWVKARSFAEVKHAGEVRKFTGDPYFVHPHAVANTVALVADDPSMVAAAECHDLIENERATREEIAAELGEDVAALVVELTHQHTKVDGQYVGSRTQRAQDELVRLSKISPRGMTIKLADILDNVPSMARYSPEFARDVYIPEKANQLAVLTQGNRKLVIKVAVMLGSLSSSLPSGIN